MRLAAATFVASLACIACSTADSAQPAYIEMGKSFSLRVGESALAREQTLRVGFEGVTSDSRCPKDEQCVWAGDAIARIWVQQGSGPKETRALHTAAGAAQAVRVLGVEVRLLSLDPYPGTGKPIANGNYVATLALSRSSSADPDR